MDSPQVEGSHRLVARPGRMMMIGTAWGLGTGVVLGLVSGNLISGFAAGLALGAVFAVTVGRPKERSTD